MASTPAGSGPPPEGTEPPPAPDPPQDLDETWRKRYEHGAKISMPTTEKIREFSLKLVLKSPSNANNNNTDNNTTTFNCHKIHKEFFEKFTEAIGGTFISYLPSPAMIQILLRHRPLFPPTPFLQPTNTTSPFSTVPFGQITPTATSTCDSAIRLT